MLISLQVETFWVSTLGSLPLALAEYSFKGVIHRPKIVGDTLSFEGLFALHKELNVIEFSLQRNLQFWSATFYLTYIQHPNDPATLVITSWDWGVISLCAVSLAHLQTQCKRKSTVSWSGESFPTRNLEKPQIILIDFISLEREVERQALSLNITVRLCCSLLCD